MGTGLRPVTPRYYKPLNPHPVEPDGDLTSKSTTKTTPYSIEIISYYEIITL